MFKQLWVLHILTRDITKRISFHSDTASVRNDHKPKKPVSKETGFIVKVEECFMRPSSLQTLLQQQVLRLQPLALLRQELPQQELLPSSLPSS